MKVDVGLFLSALDSSEVEKIRGWRNDFRVWRWTRQNDFISDLSQRDWFDRQHKDPFIRMYAINILAGKSSYLVGVCGLTSIDWQNRRAEFSLYVAPHEQRRGYGRKALELLLTHGFQNLGLHQIYGETFDGNHALRTFEALGFRRDGTRRQFYFKDGRMVDAHLISMLAGEWHDRMGKLCAERGDVSDFSSNAGDPVHVDSAVSGASQAKRKTAELTYDYSASDFEPEEYGIRKTKKKA